MKKILLFLIVALSITQTRAQFIHKIKADSVLITNDSCTAELNLENSTKNIKGFLYNKGNGRTEFKKVVKLNDSAFVFGNDTLVLLGGYTFTNGITQSGSIVQLGGQLIEPTTLASSVAANTITINGVNTVFQPGLLRSVTTGGGSAIEGTSNIGIGVHGYATTGTGVLAFAQSTGTGLRAQSGSGTALFGSSAIGKAFDLMQDNPYSLNNVTVLGVVSKNSYNQPTANGYGMAIDYNLASGSGTSRQVGREIWKWSNAADSSRSAQWELQTVNNAVVGRKLALTSTGQWVWDGYSSLTAQTDTIYYKPLAIDGSGNVVKMTNWLGSGASTLTLQQVTTNGNTTTKYINADSGYYQRGITLLHATDSILRVGYNAGIANTAGTANTAIGNRALQSNTSGLSNTAVGYEALKNVTNSSRNVAVGTIALKFNTNIDNTAVGYAALTANTTGFVNSAFGSTAMMSNTTGADNTAVGTGALRSNTTGNFNNAVGANTLFSANATGNNAMGWAAMQNTTSGNYNVAIGDSVLWSNTTGAGNTALGRNAGSNISTGSQNIAIGYKAYVPSATASNQLSIGNLIYGTGLDGTNSSISNGKIGIKTQSPVYELDVNGKLGVRTIDSTASAANILYQDAATGEIKKAEYPSKQTFAQTTSTTITTDNEATLITSGTGSLTIPASAWVVGKSYKVTVYGFYSTSASNPAGLNFRLKLGAVTIASTGGMFLGSAKNNVPYTIQATITCASTGSAGTVFTFGNVFRDGNVNPLNNGTSSSTINMTTSQTLDITATLSDDSAGNTVSSCMVFFEAAN